MGTLFLEYTIAEEHRNAYFGWIREVKKNRSFELLEGSNQPGLFVELWSPVSAAEACDWKNRRLDGNDPVWSPLHGFVAGGAEKLHIWHFEKAE